MKKIAYGIILFFINPFMGFINAVSKIRDNRYFIKIIYCWFLVFGIAFCAKNEAADSYRYKEDFKVEGNYTTEEYKSIINDYFTFNTDIKDIYSTTINYLVGQMTDNYHYVFLIYALIFGYFFIASIKIYLRYPISNVIVFFLLLFLLCFSNPIFNINGVRFWTAAWIAVYSTLKIIIDKKWIYVFLLVLTPIIHGSYFIWIVIVIIGLFLNRYERIWVLLFILSSFISAVSFLGILGDYSDYLPKFMQNMIWSYTESEEAVRKMSGINESVLYAKILNSLPSYFNILLVILFILNRKHLSDNCVSKKLYNNLLVFSTITNFISAIPSLHRFSILTIPFIVILWAMNYKHMKKYNRILYIIPIIYAYKILYWFRNMISVTEIELYVFPLPMTIIKYLILNT